MGVNKYNSEGYFDPTAYEALLAIEEEAKKLKKAEKQKEVTYANSNRKLKKRQGVEKH